MAIESTEMWSEQNSERSADNWILTRGWLVINVPPDATDDQICGANPLDGRRIPSINESHSQNAALRCRSLPISPGKGPRSRIVRARYEIPTTGDFNPQTNPLLAPIEVQPEWANREESFDVDASDQPIAVLNSVRLPFSSNPTRPTADIGFTFIRNEPIFPLVKAFTVGNTVNSDAVTLPGVGSIAAGQGFIEPIRGGRYAVNGTYVEVQYRIWLKENGWDLLIIDSGLTGIASDGEGGTQYGPFCNESGQVASQEVPLNGRGLPINPAHRFVLIGNSGNPEDDVYPAIESPTVLNSDRIVSSGGVVALRFQRFKKASWAGLF